MEIRRVIAEELALQEEPSLDARFDLDLDCDSLDFVNILTRLETLTGVRIEPGTAREIQTVRDLVEYVEEWRKP
jgi:acyl carrier protein